MKDIKNQASSSATKDSISIAPRDVLQRYDLLEAHLDKLKPGDYFVCINYKKKGVVELRRNPRAADHLDVLEKVTKEEKNTKATCIVLRLRSVRCTSLVSPSSARLTP